MVWWQVLIVVIVSYFCGNVSFARIISSAKHDDITKVGSGNPGSTNMLRKYGFKIAFTNLLLDMLKAFVPSLVCFYVFGHSYVMLYIAGASAMIGHVYPVVYKFKGGKGIASMLGVFLASNPIATVIVMLVGAGVWALLEYGSVVSFICNTVLTVVEGIRFKIRTVLPVEERKIVCAVLFIMFCVAWYAHRKNIERLLIGRESKSSLIKKTRKNLKSKKEGV